MLRPSPRRWHWANGVWTRPNIPGLKNTGAPMPAETPPSPYQYQETEEQFKARIRSIADRGRRQVN